MRRRADCSSYPKLSYPATPTCQRFFLVSCFSALDLVPPVTILRLLHETSAATRMFTQKKFSTGCTPNSANAMNTLKSFQFLNLRQSYRSVW
jgi:hypothetical protein